MVEDAIRAGVIAAPINPPDISSQLAAIQPQAPTPVMQPSTLLDKAIFTLFGRPDSKQTDEQRAQNSSDRAEANAASRSAAESPGDAFIGIPATGGGSGSESMDKVGGFIGSLARTLMQVGGVH
jgi:hypothetical protein